MSIFSLPDLGEGLTEAEIVAWHVAAGDHVVMDQPLVSVETDKALLDIPSPLAGRVEAVHGKPGDVVKVGTPLVDFAADTRAPDRGTVVGSLPGAARGDADTLDAPHQRRTAAARATPAVRALAARLSVALDGVHASGRDGTVSRDDVLAAAGAAADTMVADTVLRGVRRTMARNMSQARERVVPATLTDFAVVHDWPPEHSPITRLVRAMVAACAAAPALNAWYLDREQRLVRHQQVHLGLAADSEEGLFVPVLRDVGHLDDEALARALERLKAGVQSRDMPASELRGASITLSNFGMLGGEHAALVVLPPQVAILGAGRLAERVLALDGKATVRRTLPLSLTFDHRVVTGAEAARFMAAVISHLEHGAIA